MTLPIIKNKEENDFIQSIISKDAWLGIQKDNQWASDDGQTLTYSNWKNEPENFDDNAIHAQSLTDRSLKINHLRSNITYIIYHIICRIPNGIGNRLVLKIVR